MLFSRRFDDVRLTSLIGSSSGQGKKREADWNQRIPKRSPWMNSPLHVSWMQSSEAALRDSTVEVRISCLHSVGEEDNQSESGFLAREVGAT
jgi:hypothetical protein